MSAPKAPDMNSSTPKKICCDGQYKGMMYEPGNECPDGHQFNEEACECRECEEGDETFCAQQGYPSCYICNDGSCVPGPKCCNAIGVLSRPRYLRPGDCDELNETSCCSHRRKVYIIERSFEYQYGWQGTEEDCEGQIYAHTERTFITAKECEELVFECEPWEQGHEENSYTCWSEPCPEQKVCDNFPGKNDVVQTERCVAYLVDPDGNKRRGNADINPGDGQFPKLLEKYGAHSGSPFRSSNCCWDGYGAYVYQPYESRIDGRWPFRRRFRWGPNAGHPTVTVDSICADGAYDCYCELNKIYHQEEPGDPIVQTGVKTCSGCGEIREHYFDGFGPDGPL